MNIGEIILMQKLLYVAIGSLLILTGCGPRLKSKDFNRISIGMNKEQVFNQLGEPNINRGSTVDEKGQIVDIWEYNVSAPGISEEDANALAGLIVCTLGLALPLIFVMNEHLEIYWVYFTNNILSKWHSRTAWKKQADHIQEIRFR